MPTFAGFPLVAGQDRIFGRLGTRANLNPRRREATETTDCLLQVAETCCFACIKAHLCRRLPVASDPHALHADVGGARSRAINVSIAANIARDTATSAIWKVT
jgi:hypothetical protein